jgi:hypothetical protein
MTLIEVLSARLLANADLAAVVGGDVYPDKAPQETQPPFVVFFIVDGTPETSYTSRAADEPAFHRLQVDCYAADALRAAQLAQLVRDAIGDLNIANLPEDPSHGLQVNKTIERASYDDEAQLDRVLLEFSVFW